ncbi:MAG: hypothetical protein ISS80_04955 [Candidatus Cloacimonetes bacterium]|nr:hypothetical protein [Candidatus Cloacimonadota bacterium]MBL7149403.1 hypothetical protein [Candidatus Cloacimonadota bacterium]
MSNLLIYDKKITSFFQLLGEKENNISYSVGWALANCKNFLTIFIKKTLKWKQEINYEGIRIQLQKYEFSKGFTDIEVEQLGDFHLIIEAKRGWNLPTIIQLQKYASRKKFINSSAPLKKIIVLSECTQHYVEANHEVNNINGIKVTYLTWRDIYNYSLTAIKKGSYTEKRYLSELNKYLEDIMTIQKIDSNRVFVVSLARGKPDKWNISWIDIVKKKSFYFHPIAKHWPYEPPNYIAFRYEGKLQSIHHIKKYEVFTNPHKIIQEIPNEKWERHYLYKLDKAFLPQHEVKNGKIYRNSRCWCMLDTLLTCKTIAEASDVSKKRLERFATANNKT